MSTAVLSNAPSKPKKQYIFKLQSYRTKVPLILTQQNTQRQSGEHQCISNHIHLPTIYKTQNLLTAKGTHHNPFCKFDKENQFNMPKIFKKNVEHATTRKYQNFSKILGSEQAKRQGSLQPVYHNFIAKKNKKKVYMSKIIEKVISQDIEPWVLQSSFLQQKQKMNEISYLDIRKKQSEEICKYQSSPYVRRTKMQQF